MALTSAPINFRIYRPGSRHIVQSVGEELSSGVKHTHMGPVGVGYSIQKGPNDAIGTATVAFSGVNAGSEIRVYLPNGDEAAGVESCNADHVLSWSIYSVGAGNNVVTIRIVHPNYRIKEFLYTTLQSASQSIPIQQEPDRWYSNPA